jgi:hypothetical protein
MAADPAVASGWSDCGGAMDRPGRGDWQVGLAGFVRGGSRLFSVCDVGWLVGFGDVTF